MKRKVVEEKLNPTEVLSAKVTGLEIPYDCVNEQVLISAACLDAGIRKGLTQRLRPEAFIVEKHQPIWEALCEMARRDLDYDPSTLAQISGGKADADYVQSLIQGRDKPPANLKHHAELLLWDRARVECAKGSLSTFLNIFQDPTSPPERVKMAARSVLLSLDSDSIQNKAIDPKRLTAEASKLLEQFRGNYFEYGLPGLDHFEDGSRRFNPGTSPGMTTVVTAVSGGGKSTLLAQLALAQGPGIKSLGIKGLGRTILYGAWEMPAPLLLNLFACMSLGFSRTKVFTGEFTQEEEKAIGEEKEHILQYIKFKDQPRIKSSKNAINEALDSVYGMISDSGADVAIFDLWERIFSLKSEGETREALFRQQEIGKELKVHQFLAAQQKLKEVEQREDRRPTRDCIKDSSGWVDIADTIIGTNLPHLWKNLAANVLEILILKQRYGR
ncbi:MAG: hypothetical protein KGL39_24805, partial [Patescibacteria group bacterium]|nr:hypothetical protein [Patescibacteria group bacterium]